MPGRYRAGGIFVAMALAAAILASGSSSAASKSAWQTLLSAQIQGIFPLGWASDRAWFVVEGNQDEVTLYSARVASGRMTSVVATPEGKNEWLPNSFIVGSSLVNCCVQQPGSAAAPLLAGGKAGAWAPIPGNPEQTTDKAGFTPSEPHWAAVAGATAGGRTIWALNGHTCPNSGPHQCTVNGGGFAWFALCCTAGGAASNVTSLLTRTTANATDVTMGVDATGRLWLAWLDGASSKPGVALKLVQVDAATLKVLSSKTLDHVQIASVGGPHAFTLVCTNACRLAYQTMSGAFSWDGAAKPVRLWATNFRKGTGGQLVGAAGRAAGLAVANYGNRVANSPDSGQRITLERGDAAGRHLRKLGSLTPRQSIPLNATHSLVLRDVPTMIFTPASLVVLGFYWSLTNSPSRILGAVLHG
jgi:hypothetical protein